MGIRALVCALAVVGSGGLTSASVTLLSFSADLSLYEKLQVTSAPQELKLKDQHGTIQYQLDEAGEGESLAVCGDEGALRSYAAAVSSAGSEDLVMGQILRENPVQDSTRHGGEVVKVLAYHGKNIGIKEADLQQVADGGVAFVASVTNRPPL